MIYSTLIDADTLATHLHDSRWVLLDCRFDLTDAAAGEKAYSTAHIEGARYAHLDRDLAAAPTATSGRHPLPDPADFARRAGAWGIDAATQIVAYDQGNSFYAARAWWLFRWLGHERVAVLDGGLAAWTQGNRPLTTATPRIEPRGFIARPDPRRVANVDEVLSHLGDPAVRLVDARSAERYAGGSESIDPISGHVPGAVSHHYGRNLDTAGLMRPIDALRSEWTGTLGGVQAEQMIAMCGSGVSACVNLLAMEHAGIRGARLYPGSWSEWIRDPGRPVARGSTP
ncbi:MAG: sulfurtransferase [Sinobacteraceae bacterium]|nr:sulfurtransferase [Nevskiaceae bacterium]